MRKLSLRLALLALGSVMSVHRVGYGQVVSPPTISKAFGAATIPILVPTSLTFTITNPNTNISLTGVAFTDNLPAGLAVAAPNNLSGSCGGGTIMATAGSTTISLSGATLAASGSCTFSVNVLSPLSAFGVMHNTTGNVTSSNGGTGGTASASITVVAPTVPNKAFGAPTIPLNSTTSLTFTITNPNAVVPLTGVSLSDSLPAGLVITTPNGLTGSCGGGTITATAGSTTISLAGGTLAVSASCTFSVNVTGTTAGVKNNNVTVTSTEGDASVTTTASITVLTTTATPTAIPTNTPTPLPVVPTLKESGMLIFGLLIATSGLLLLLLRR